ncbi:Phthiocerol synthesis polyketide synthase type I PpsD [Streptomyces davaonensis JCM 4913]|uniref:Phthiocerol synthesis polyketide synthase type I PpsD n=1 Tax=Streptomyces davaonensis (strain DSM 101723 / JCM 4913 / KCC S-0913 / 768) TaxID=1214101 RepID=K4R1H9_STRDJ|nr:type I polyketide synthase [Streptomyces davaonensis]CCK26519.1 Phthiocerol synthesis polyketide synthase type I PpsD [Streptomyces davaonensis JCM 4913]
MTDLAGLIGKLSPKARAALARELSADAGPGTPEPIAVVGLGCRYPGGADTPERLWDLLAEGGDAVTRIPDGRWDVDAYYSPDPDMPGRMPHVRGGFLADAAGFDAEFFGISPREALAMDPQQRLLLEVAWEALEHSGTDPASLRGTRTGVYTGIAAPDYLMERLLDPDGLDDPHTVTGGSHSTAVGRLSYLLDLRGPSIAVDTACSSSLVAVHLACQALRTGDTDLALAGGVHVISSPLVTIALYKGGITDPDGHCKAFDADAAGFVRAEGCGVVVLKRLSDALRDGDPVRAVIRGSAVNQDGLSNSLTSPSVAAQRAVLAEAVERAGVDAGAVGLVETHGTGTPIGDPIEVTAVTEVYGRGGQGRCALGAAKTNMGHCEEAAGVLGLIKTVLCLQHGRIPPNVHFRRLNPDIDLDGTRLFVPTSLTDWPVTGGGPRLAAVSSFGMGGTNAHVVLEQAAPAPAGPPEPAERTWLIPVSGASPGGLRANAERLADWLRGPGQDVRMRDLAHTLGRRRAQLSERAVVVADSPDALAVGLKSLTAGEPGPNPVGSVLPAAAAGAVWIFSGHGSQWSGMGRELLAGEPEFARVVDRLEPVVAAESDLSLRATLLAGDYTDGVPTQIALFAVQVGLAAVWRSRGLEPAAVLGHSMGEVSAAVVSGALSLEDGARVLCRRVALLRRGLQGKGTMALVELDWDEAERRLAGHASVSVAVGASPRSTVVSGAVDAIEELVADWQAEGLLARRIKGAEGAGHSPQVDPLLPELRARLADLAPARPRVAFYSTAHPDPHTTPTCDADYWAANLRNPVRFTQAVEAAARDGLRVFVEVSPHPIVAQSVTETLDHAGVEEAAVVPTLRRDQPEVATLLTHLGQLHCLGVPLDPDLFHPAGTAVDLPLNSWQHRRYWLSEGERRTPAADTGAHPLLGAHIRLPGSPARHVWQARVSLDRLPWLADHSSRDLVVMPGTGYCEIALAAAGEAFGAPPEALRVTDVEYRHLLVLNRPVDVTTELTRQEDGTALVEIATASHTGARVVHATARVHRRDPLAADRPAPSLSTLMADHPGFGDPAEVYARMRRFGQFHGPAFAGLVEVRRPTGEPGEGLIASTLCRVEWPKAATRHPHYRVHPAFLDACLHAAVACVPEVPGRHHLPAGIRRLDVHGDFGTVTYCHAEVRAAPEEAGYLARLHLLDAQGHLVAELDGLYFKQFDEAALPVSLHDKLYAQTWERAALPEPPADPRPVRWLVLDDGADGSGPETGQVLARADWRDPDAVAAALAADTDCTDVLFRADGPAPGHGEDTLAEGAARVLAVSRVVAGLAGRAARGAPPPRLWLLTRGAQSVDPGERPDLAQVALRGLGRSLLFEHPELRPTLLDLDPGSAGLAELAAEVASGATDDEIAWRAGERRLARLTATDLPAADPTVPVVRPGGGYLVTGGLTGLGLFTAGRLVEQGAGCVVLNARSAPSPEAEEAIRRMRATGAQVVVVRGDIAEPGTARGLVEAVHETGATLRGVIHSAAALDDGVIAGLDAESLEKVWRPKAVGAWRLHEATEDLDLDWWTGYSSIAALLGAGGQGNYAAASAWLDGLAQWRAAAGLPALSVNWGGWAEIGAARDLELAAFGLLRPQEGIEALEGLLAHGRTRAGVTRIHPGLLAETYPELTGSSFFAGLLSGGQEELGAGDWPGPDALSGLSGQELLDTVHGRLVLLAGRTLGMPAGELDPARPLVKLGLDSLMAVRIKNAVQRDFGMALPVALLLQGASVDRLAREVVRALPGSADDPVDDEAAQIAEKARARAARRGRRGDRRKDG